jgi:hypothetical protein
LMLAYCPVCEQLVRIIPGDWKRNGKQRWYWTVKHEAAGKPCEGGKI